MPFETREAAEYLNSLCNFCGLIKFYIVEHDGWFQLLRCDVDVCDKHCQWNHANEVVYQPQADHNDTMSIVRGHG